MRITTLGTSHGDHTYCRYNSSTLIETEDRSYLVDGGEPVSASMVRAGKPFDALRAVFITHTHGDHINGLPNLVKFIAKYPRQAPPVDIFLPERKAADGLDGWLRSIHVNWPSDSVVLRIARQGLVFDDGVLRATALPTRHMEKYPAPCFAYVLEAEGKRVIVTGDLTGDFSDFPALARQEPCDLCLCEVTHYDPVAAVPILAGCPIRRMVFHHVHNPWHGQEGERKLRDILAPLPFPFDIAHDGDEFEV